MFLSPSNIFILMIDFILMAQREVFNNILTKSKIKLKKKSVEKLFISKILRYVVRIQLVVCLELCKLQFFP